jgi:hypothetical protein
VDGRTAEAGSRALREEVSRSGIRPVAEPTGRIAPPATIDFVPGIGLFSLTGASLILSEVAWSGSLKLVVALGIASAQAWLVVAAFMDRGRPRELPLLLFATVGALMALFIASSVLDRAEYQRDISGFEDGR